MASISKLQNGKFKCRVRRYGVSLSSTFRTRKAAQAWGERKERELEQDRALGYAESTLRRLTFAEVALGYIEHWGTLGRKDLGRLKHVRWWMDEIGNKRILDVDKVMIRNTLNRYAAGNAQRYTRDGRLVDTGRKRSGASVNRLLAALSAVFTWAMDALDVPDNPCKRVKGRHEPKGSERYLSEDERARLLEAAKGSRCKKLYLFVVLALSTGARRGELEKLAWNPSPRFPSYVDMKDRRAIVYDTKNGETRVLPLTDEALAELRKHREIGPGLVLSGHRPFNPVSLSGPFHEARKQAGVAHCRIHDLRHTAGFMMAEAGKSAFEIAQVLGHRDLRTTQRYMHYSQEAKRAMVVEVLGNLTGGNGK